jgi:alkanesulfonate monooxygenase SsuD/methylene tetrahydromethanopterin reductase-like flavin-dependent oxidoreductase (luciferase family)
MPELKFDVTFPVFAGGNSKPRLSRLSEGHGTCSKKQGSGLPRALDCRSLDDGEDHHIWEGWTIISSLVNMSKLRIGTAMLKVVHRNPALLAKMAATLDVISNRLLNFGIGAGWHKSEVNSITFRGLISRRKESRCVQKCVEKIERWAETGVQRFKFCFFDYPDFYSFEKVGKEIIPSFS